MSVAFWLGPVSGAESWDHIRWIRLHGLKVDMSPVGDELYYGVQFPTPCRELRCTDGRYVCGIYDERPSLCRNFDCTDSAPTLFKVENSAWMVWLEEHPSAPNAAGA